MKKPFTIRLLYKNILACLLLVFIGIRLEAQSITSYAFAQTTTTFTALTTPTTVSWTGNNDDAVSSLIPIGFDFWYMGTRYTDISASTNGWFSLGTTLSDYLVANNLSTGGAPRPVIAPLWDDLDINANTNVTYKTTGTEGSRVFTIQYLNVKWYYLASGSVISFQAKLYENTGRIEFIYKPETTNVNTPSASIGITATATGSGNFLSVNNAGTSVSSTTEANVTTRPVSGKRYAFTPPVPIAPGSLTFSSVGGTGMTLHWSDLSSNETGFAIYRSTDGVNYSFVSQTAAGATSSIQSGLTGSTTYYWKVYAVSAGALSTALSGSQATTTSVVLWYNSAWLYRKAITIDYTKVGPGPHTNFPVLISSADIDLQTKAQTDGDDILFTSADGSTKLDHQVESYTSGTGTVVAWVEAPSLSSAANTVIYMYYGNVSATPQQNITGTWNNSYKGVWHLNSVFTDATSNANNGTNTGTITATGKISGGSGFVRSDGADHVLIPGLMSSPTSFTLSAWATLTTADPNGSEIVSIGDYSLLRYDESGTNKTSGVAYNGASVWTTTPSGINYAGTGWHYVVYTFDDAGNAQKLYVDGAQVGTTSSTVTPVYTGGGTNTFIGKHGNSNVNMDFDGTIDEVRISDVNRSAGWVLTEYNNQNAPPTFYSVGSEVTSAKTFTGTGNFSDATKWTDGTLPVAGENLLIDGTCTIDNNAGTDNIAYGALIIGTATGRTLNWATNGTNRLNVTNISAGTGASTLNMANGGTLIVRGAWNSTNLAFTPGTGTVEVQSSITLPAAYGTFNNLTINNASATVTAGVNTTVTNNLTITAGTLNTNNFNVTVKGNWTNNAATTAFTAGTATVTFNSATAKTIGGSFATTFNNLTIADSGNVVTLNVNASIAGNLTVSGGTFDLAGFTANRASAGGILMVANNATLKIGGTNTYPTNYTTNTLVVASTVEYSGTNQTVANQTYGNLKLSSASGAAVKTFPGTALAVVGNLSSVLGAGTSLSFTAAENIAVSGNVSIGTSTTFNGGSYAHNIGGNWVNNGTFNGNTSTVTFSGAGTAISGSGTQNFNNLTVAASMVSFSNGSITVTGNLSTTGAGSFSQASGGTLLMTGTTKTISGLGISLDNLTVSGSVSTATPFTLTGNLSVSGSFTSTGTVTMSGASKTVTGAGSMSFAVLSATGSITTNANFSITSGLIVNGSLSASAGTATFTGTSTLSGAPNLFNVTINGTSLQLSANAILGIANVMTVTSGTLNVTSSAPNTVNFNGTGAQNINALTYSNLIVSNGNTKTLSGTITTNSNVTIGAGTTLNPSSHTIYIYGDWNNNGTFTPATSTVEFLGPAIGYLNGATTFNILTSNTTNATTQLFLNNNMSASVVNMTNGIFRTGSNTLTITNTRTGAGLIYGNIQRNHAFTTGVAYAFEGPENTITFSSVSSVNSVTVSVVQGTISDFPFGGSIGRVYNISVPAGTYTADLRLHYEDGELNGNSESSMGLWQYNGSSWGSIGKTANSTTSNYVEQSGLTNITDRWTCSDDGNVVQWNGSVSTDWNTAANWTAVQGSASTPPSATDIVNLGTVAFTNQPTISSTVNVKNINFGSVQAVTLSMASGGSLTSGDINGAWSSNATHTINTNNQSITINGNLNLTDGVNGHAIDLNIGSGTVTISGSLLEDGGADVSFTGNGTLNIAEDFHKESGVFTAGSGTVIYNGPSDQHVAHVSYNNLTLNKSGGIASIDSLVNIAGNLLISAGELENTALIDISGNVTISSGAILHNGYMLYVGGNWINNGTYIGTGAQTFFNGSGTQTVSATNFNNLIIDKPVGSIAELTGNVVIGGDLTITSGTFDIKTFTCDRNVPGGSIVLGDSATFIIGGNNPPVNFTGGSLSYSSTVIANGTIPQAIIGAEYGHLIFRNSGVKTLLTPITVHGNLTIESGATFNADSNTVTLHGNWINSGTFIPSTGTVVCAGSAKTISGNTTFNHATVTGSYTLLGNMTFNGLLNITSTGSFSAGGTIHTTMNGDLINSGVLFTLGTTTFTGNVVQTLSLINAVNTVALRVNFNGSVSPVLNSTSVPQFGYLTINNTGGVHPSVGWTILYSLTIGSGATFNGGPSTHNILGAVTNNGTISSSGTLNFIPSSAVPVNLGSNFSSTGTVNFGGAGAMTLAGTPVSFHDVVISNTNVAGITPSFDWTITNNFTVNSGSTLNAGNHSWLIAGNILSNGAINSGTSTFTLNGSGTQNIATASAFNNLTINKVAGSTTLSSNVTVNGALDFIAGKIQTGSNRIIQPSTGTVIGAAQNTGWVVGKLQKNIITGATSKTFEIGDATNYTPVSVAFSNVTTAGDLTAFTTAGDHPDIGTSTISTSETVNRFWTLTNSGIGFTDYSATFNYVAADLDPGVNTNTLIAGKYNGSSWTYPTVGTLTATSLQATGLTSFEDFQVGRMIIFSKTWDGGAGTSNWGDAANWNTDGVPAATDDVDLTGANIINIDVAATTKNLLLDNTSLVLTTLAGNSLTVSGNLTLANGTFNTAADFPTVSGTINVAGGTVGFVGSIPQTIPAYNYNNITSSSTGSRTFTNSGPIGIAGTFTAGTNTYTTTGSTIDLNGGGAQPIPTLNYNNLTLSNAGVKTFDAGTACIAGVLSITGTAIAKATTNFATVKYNGSANQTITPMTYYGLDISSTGGIVSGTDPVVTNFSMNSGTVDLNASTLAIPGITNCVAGIINNGTVTATGEKTIFAGTTFGTIVHATSDSLYLNGSKFNSTTTITKIGAANIICSGGNVFNDTATITNDSIGNFTLGNIAPDTFNGETIFNNTETAGLYIANNSAGNFFNGKVTFNNIGTSSAIRSGFDALSTATYNGNIVLNNTATGGIYFGNTGGLTTLAALKTITIGATGFNKGILLLRNFTQSGSTAQALTLTGTATLQIGPASTLNGNVNFTSPQLKLNGGTFNGTASLTKSGATDNSGTGGNIFNGITTIYNNGSGSLDLGDTSPEQFNEDVTISNTGTSRIQVGISSVGNVFNGDVTINHGGNTASLNTIIARSAGCTATIHGNLILNNTNTNTASGIIVANSGAVNVNGNIIVSSTNGRGILFGDAIGGAVTLGNGFTIADAGAGSFTTGMLSLKGFTQTGTTAQNIALTGTASLIVGPTSQFNGAINFSAPQLFLNGCQYNSTAIFTKNGATDNTSIGNNIFNAATTITNSGTGFLRLANTGVDDFNSNATFIQTGSGLLQPSYATNCTIAGNLSTAGTATAITFGGTVTLNGTGAQSISSSLSPTFNNLTISNTGNTVTAGVHSIVKGNLSVSSGTFDLGAFNANRLTAGGTLTISNGAKLKIGAANTIPSNYTTHSIGATSTVEYSGANQTVAVLNSAQNYGHLTISGAGTETNDDIAVRNNLSITAGSLDINANTLKIGGSITNSGTFTASIGTIEMNGSSAQTVPASTFVANRVGNLTVNNTAGVTLGGTLDLVGILLASNGQLSTGGYLTLMSSDTQTALIDGSGSGEVLGNVTMQRYLPSGFGYKYFSSPFQAATVNEFSDELDLGASFAPLYRYDESLASSGWVKYTTPTDSLVPFQGYAANLGADSAAKMVDMTGVVNNHTISAPALYNHNQPYTLGFNLVGNPYPSPIDWSIAEGWDRTNIDDAVYYFNAGGGDQYTGTYSSYINGISSDEHAGYIIPAMQGFFVHVTNGTYPVSGSLSVNNNARVNDLQPYFHKPEPTTAPLLRLNAGFADERPASDPVVVYFDDNAQSTFDKELDALKIMNSDPLVPNLYVNAPGATTQSICAWPYLKDSTDVIPLGLRTKQAGWITFSSPIVERMPFGWHIYLYDATTRSRYILDDKMKYRLHLDAGDYENRFFLMFSATQYPDVEGIFNAYAKDGKLQLLIEGIGNEKCDVSIANMLGQVILRKRFDGKGRYEIDSQFSSGVYIVSFYVNNHVFSQKIYIGN